MGNSSMPLFSRTSPVPTRPLTAPRKANAPVAQVIVTPVTLAASIVPVPPPTVHVWDGPVGCVNTSTLYAASSASRVLNVKLPLFETARSLPSLSWSTRPSPSNPVTVPLTVKLSCAPPDGGGSESTLPRPFEHAASAARQHSK